MKAGFLWYSHVDKSITINSLDSNTRFTQPIFAMGGQFATKSLIYDALKPYCDNLKGYVIENCGHYIPEEAPQSVIDSIITTFGITA